MTAVEQQRGSKRALNLVLTALASVTIVVLIAVIAIPNYINGGPSPLRACQANLKLIQGAKATWALDHDKKNAEAPAGADLFGPTKYASEKPVCPAGGTYTLGSVAEMPRCSILGHTI